MEDKKLCALLRKSPEKGLEAAIREYGGYVYKIAYIKLGDICPKEDIEEAVSDIFYKFYQSGSRQGFEIKTIRGFLAVIAVRHCAGVFRSKAGEEKTVPLSELENLICEYDICDGGYITDMIKSLGEPDSSIFIRKYYLGQRNKDIAKELGIKEGTLNTRISRGLVKLRKILEEDM